MADDKPEETPEEKPAGDAGPSVTVVYHRGYTESQAVLEELDKNKVAYRARDVYEHPLGREELSALLDGQDDLARFLNIRSTEYRDRRMDGNPPSVEMALELMHRDPTLLQVPILLKGDDVCVARVPQEALDFLGIKPVKKKRPVRKRAAKKAVAKKAAAKEAKPGAAKQEVAAKEAKPDAAKKEAAAKEAAAKEAKPEAAKKEAAAKEAKPDAAKKEAAAKEAKPDAAKKEAAAKEAKPDAAEKEAAAKEAKPDAAEK